MSGVDNVCFFCNRDNLKLYIFLKCSHRICSFCLYERIFSNHIHEFQGQIKLRIKCKCESGYLDKKQADIINLIVEKDSLEEKEDNEKESENDDKTIEGCECSAEEKKIGKKFSDFFCMDCFKFICKKCKDDIKNKHIKHRIRDSFFLLKTLRNNIKTVNLRNKTLEEFNEKFKNFSEEFSTLIDNNYNNTIKNLDDLMESVANLKEFYIRKYKEELGAYLKTFKLIKIYYLNYYNDKKKELTNKKTHGCNIYKLKYLNNITYELAKVQMKHSDFFNKEVTRLKKFIDKLLSPDFSKKLIEGKFIFEEIKKGFKMGEKFQAHKKFINGLIVSYHNNKIITSSFDSTLKIWEPDNQKLVQEEKKKISNIFALKNGKILASSMNDLLIFEYKDGKYVNSQSITMHNKNIVSLGELEDGTLMSGGEDKKIILWKENPNNKQYYAYQTIETKKEIQNILALNDFKIAYSGIEDGIISILDTEISLNDRKMMVSNKYSEKGELPKLKGKISCMCKLNQDYFVSGGGDIANKKIIDHNIYIWKPGKNNYALSQTLVNAHESDINCLILLRDGKFASSSKDRKILIWKVGKSRMGTEIEFILCQKLDEYNHGLYKLIQLDDDRIVSVSSDNSLVFWNNTSDLF